MADVGFATLPNQIHRYVQSQGFDFNVMVVGEAGLGKSTLINTLFASPVFIENTHPGPGRRIPSTVTIQRTSVSLVEDGVKMRLTLTDTPGFGNAIDNTGCWKPLAADLDAAFDKYMDDESRISRDTVQDTRTHCCLYVVAPSADGLKPLDITVLTHLHQKVNIILCIGKADSLSAAECVGLKEKIRRQVEDNEIQVYQFPPADEEEDDARSWASFPFAVAASETIKKINGRVVRVRTYPWGVVEIDNVEHSEFTQLRNLLIRTHLQDLIETTHVRHYEAFRCGKLQEIALLESTATHDSESNPMAQFERQKEQHERKMDKMEAEMTQVFQHKVREKEKRLKDAEAKLLQQHDEMQRDLQVQRRLLEQRRADFEAEKNKAETDSLASVSRSMSMSRADTPPKKKKGLF